MKPLTDEQFECLIAVLERIAVALEKSPPRRSWWLSMFKRA